MATNRTKIEVFKTDREAIGDKLEYIKSQIDNHDETNIRRELVDTFMKECDHLRERLDLTHSRIRELKPTDIADHKADYFVLLEAVRLNQHLLWDIRHKLPAPTPNANPGTANKHNVKLPKLELQAFHGDYLEWISFKDSFQSAIHNNPSVSKVEKFGYLKSLLKGESARHVADLAITDANYDLAWQQLHDRYQNKRKIIMAVVDRFRNYPKSNGSAKSIKGLIDATNRCMRALELQGYEKNDLVDFLFYHEMITKLDSKARDLWEHMIKGPEIPKIVELCEFLERHSTAMEESGAHSGRNPEKERKSTVLHTQPQASGQARDNNQSRPNRSSRQNSQPNRHDGRNRQNNQANGQDNQQNAANRNSCLFGCNHSHPFFKCQKFLRASLRERRAMARLASLCFNCLNTGHMSKDCTRSGCCRKCSGSHNTLLHEDTAQGQDGNPTLHTATGSEESA